MTDNVQNAAHVVEQVDEALMKALPFITFSLGLVPVPGVGVAATLLKNPLMMEVLQKVDEAAKAVEAGKPGAGINVLLDEINDHLTPGAPNSPALNG